MRNRPAIALTDDDRARIPDFTYVMPLVVESAPGGQPIPLSRVFGVAQDALRAADMPTMPRGMFGRLCRATGLLVSNSVMADGRSQRFIHGIRLRHEDMPMAPPDAVDQALAHVSFAEPYGMEPIGAVTYAVTDVLRADYYVTRRAVRDAIWRAGYQFTFPAELGRRSYVAGIALHDEFALPE